MNPETSTSVERGRAGRRITALGATAALTAAWLLTAGTASAPAAAHTGSAQSQLGVLQCLGTESDTYSPGVTLQARQFTVTTAGRFTSCLDGAGAVVSGAYGPERFTLDAGCSDLFDAFHSVRTIRWNTGDTSVMEGNGQSNEAAGQVITTITGTITQGRFQGQSAVQTITLPQPGVLQCLTTGYTGATGVTTLTVG
ncbi:MAG: hypothetical protein ACJ786_06935 [Catenulispora sp.]